MAINSKNQDDPITVKAPDELKLAIERVSPSHSFPSYRLILPILVIPVPWDHEWFHRQEDLDKSCHYPTERGLRNHPRYYSTLPEQGYRQGTYGWPNRGDGQQQHQQHHHEDRQAEAGHFLHRRGCCCQRRDRKCHNVGYQGRWVPISKSGSQIGSFANTT